MFLFNFYLLQSLRSCVFNDFATLFFFFCFLFFKCIDFEISSAVVIVAMFFWSEIPIISRKSECLRETSGRWVGESERMLSQLAAYGHFH